MAAWAPLVPLAKARTGLDEAALGTVLLCLGAGSVVAMPVAGRCAARIGHRRTIVVAALIACIALPFLALADRAMSLATALFAFGAGLGALDVAMNLEAIDVERAHGRPLMSGFHGMFSVGGVAGASGASLALGAGIGPIAIVAALALASIAAIVSVSRGLSSRPTSRDASRPTFAMPHGIVLAIGLVACTTFLVEGAMLDWSAVFLASARSMGVDAAGTGYVAFSIAMTVGRFTGDRVVARFGGPPVLVTGALVAAAGLAIAALVPEASVAVAGFTLVGLGCANIVPVLFTAAGRQTSMPPSLAVPAMTTMGYAGLLAGPAAIGYVANATSLAAAFVGLAIVMGAVAWVGRVVLR